MVAVVGEALGRGDPVSLLILASRPERDVVPAARDPDHGSTVAAMPTPGFLARKTTVRVVGGRVPRVLVDTHSRAVIDVLNPCAEVILHRLDDPENSGFGALETQHEISERYGVLHPLRRLWSW